MATGIPKSKSNGSAENQHGQRIGGELRLTYQGKRTPSGIIADCPKPTLTITPPSKHSDRWANRLYFGDNFEILGALLDDPAVRGQVSLIYIDPPYNTGSAFEHYDDNLEHSTWLNLMKPRLEILRNLLSKDGSIWISIDDTEQAYLKILMDEVFGEDNFLQQLVWQRHSGGGNDSRHFATDHEYILVFAKNKDSVGRLRMPLTEDDKRDFKLKDRYAELLGPYKTK